MNDNMKNEDHLDEDRDKLTIEPTPRIETIVKGLVFSFFRPFSLFNIKETDEYLKEVRSRNEFPYLQGTLVSVTIGVVTSLLGLYFTTDDIDVAVLTHLRVSNVSTDFSAFVFWMRDFPIAILLAAYSYIFYGATKKYLKVFEPSLAPKGEDILRWPRYLVHTPQVLAILVLTFGYTTAPLFQFTSISTILCTVSAALFASAALFPRMLERDLRNRIVELHSSPALTDNPLRKARLKHIYEVRVFGFVYKGWSTLNFIFAIFVLLYAAWPEYLSRIFTIPGIHIPALQASYAILFSAVIFSFVGALRSYSKEMDQRYFNSVKIVNFEHLQTVEPDDNGSAVEEALNKGDFFSIEGDPTLPTQPIEKIVNKRSIGAHMLFAPTLESARFSHSAFFGAFLLLSSGDVIFSLLTALALVFAFLLNDIVDYWSGKDMHCHPDRPLPSGRLSINRAIQVLLLTAIVFALIFATTDVVDYGVPGVLFLGGIAYSLFLKPRIPLVATPFWCGLLALALASAMSFGLYGLLAVWMAVQARELVLDLRDAETDYRFNAKNNIARALGKFFWPTFFGLVVISSFLFFAEGKGATAISVLIIGVLLGLLCAKDRRLRGEHSGHERFAKLSHLAWPIALLLP